MVARAFKWGKGWRKERASDNSCARIFDAQGQLVRMEYYEPTGVFVAKSELVNVRVETAVGELICRHIDQPVSATAYDIHIIDAAGRLRGIIHHSDVDRGEPYTICEEWFN